MHRLAGKPTGNSIAGVEHLLHGVGHSVDTTGTILDTAFHHIAAVRQGSVVRIWIDGSEQGTVTVEGAAGFFDVSNPGPFVLGRLASRPVYFLRGRIDEPSVYNRALSPAEIQAIFDAGSAGKDKVAPLVGTGTFTWEMKSRTTADAQGRIIVPNTPEWVNPGKFEIGFHAGSFLINNHPAASYSFIIEDYWGNIHPALLTSDGSSTTASEFTALLPEGFYTVTLTASDGQAQVSTSQTVQVRDILVVAMGDSYSSGEGNPERSMQEGNAIPAQWMQSSDVEAARQHAVSHRSWGRRA